MLQRYRYFQYISYLSFRILGIKTLGFGGSERERERSNHIAEDVKAKDG